MRHRSLLNLILLLLVLAITALIWWLQPTPLPTLTQLQPEEVVSIRITDNTGRDIHLTRVQGNWRLNQMPANQSRINQLLAITQTPSLRRFSVPIGRLDEFGLQPPAIRLRLNDLELAFGNTDPVHGWRYVLNGKLIHLIGDGFQHHLTAPASAFLAEE